MSRLSEETQDYLFLFLIIVLSFLLYTGGLGFYSDDWAFFGASYKSPDRTIWGLYHSLDGPVVWMRPVQVFYLAALYRTFDLQPLGYHVVNHSVFVAGILCFYAVLRLLSQPRIACLAVPLVFGLLPHYSTDRIWPILFCANLSMTTYFLSLYCDLRMLESNGLRIWIWKLLGVLFLLAGALAYEVFLPLFLFNFVLVWICNRQRKGAISRRLLVPLLGVNILALSLIVFFKAATTTRIIMQGAVDHAIWFLDLIKKATVVSFIDYGFKLPVVIYRLVSNHADWAILAVSLICGILIHGYLNRILNRSERNDPRSSHMRNLFFAGLLVFVFGYVIFITNENADPTPSGLNNRTSIAATVGVALAFVGMIGWICTRIRSGHLRKQVFCFLIAVICSSGVFITNVICKFWIVAYAEQQKILTDIRAQYQTLPSGTTLILDGVCPYLGPAIVFESDFDLAGALRLYYQDYNLHADVVKPSLKINDEGLQTSLYGETTMYPYKNLVIYNYKRKVSQPIHSADDASRYFQAYNPHFGMECPEGREGVGVPIF